MKSITITDVARRAGVSIKTVSRVMNGEPHVSAQLREQVLNAARELRYRPNMSARSLRGNRSYVIGFLLSGLTPRGDQALDLSPYTTQAQLGALSACRKAGYHLLAEAIDLGAADFSTELELISGVLAVDGMILPPPYCDNAAILDVLDKEGVPYARMAPSSDLGRSPYVAIDDQGAARTVTEHLLALGHERIAFINGPGSHGASIKRLTGFQGAMKGRGLATPDEFIRPGLFTFESGLEAAISLLNLPDPPTAIFAANDLMALGVVARAQELGHQLPDTLSVAGFDDIPWASMVRPGLTTMRQPVAEMASVLTDMLIAGAGDEKAKAEHPHRTLICELIIRGSTAPPAGPD